MADWYPFPVPRRSVCRTMDVRHLNEVANHPDVRPGLGGDGVLDLRALIENPENLAFETEHGGLIAVALGSGRYDIHTLFLPEGRGVESAEALQDIADIMFAATDCTDGRTTVPIDRREAAIAARRLGFWPLFQMGRPWTGGTTVMCDFFSLSIDRWALHTPTALVIGDWFHQALERAKVT